MYLNVMITDRFARIAKTDSPIHVEKRRRVLGFETVSTQGTLHKVPYMYRGNAR